MGLEHARGWSLFQVMSTALAAASLVSCRGAAAPPGGLVSLEEEGNIVVQSPDGAPFTTLWLEDVRVPYLWPIVGPGGHEMTRAFPMDTRPGEADDHPHHQSLWLTHGSVNGHDFWHDPLCKILLRGEPVIAADEGDFSLRVSLPLSWRGQGGVEVLRETRVFRLGEGPGQRLIEVSSTFEASSGDVLFADTKEGTFGVRVRPELRLKGKIAQGAIVNSEGDSGAEAWGKRARWVAYEAPLEAERVGICVMDHPLNLRHPTWWHARDYGLLAANPFGAHDFEGAPEGAGDFVLQAGTSMTQRYLVVLRASEGAEPIGVSGYEELMGRW